MRLPMRKREASKLEVVEDTDRWRLTRQSEDENCNMYFWHGKFQFEFSTVFGIGQRDYMPALISFSLVDVVRDHLGAEGWMWEASQHRYRIDVDALRAQLEQSIELIDRLEAHIAAEEKPKKPSLQIVRSETDEE